MDLISLLVVFIVVCALYWAVHRVAAAFGLPAQMVVVFDVLLVLLLLIYVLRAFSLMPRGL